MIAARCLTLLAALCLLVGAPIGFLSYSPRVGVGWLVCGAVLVFLAWDVARVTRRSQRERRRSQRTAVRLLTSVRRVPSVEELDVLWVEERDPSVLRLIPDAGDAA